MTEDPRLIESPKRLSESKLWDIQKNYFSTMGIEAWKEEVPFYISSNAFIAHRYAMLIIHYIKDCHRVYPQSLQQTFYLVEIGSGTGKFSFYFLKAFKTLLAQYQLEKQSFCYVITDLIENNIQFCENHPCFKPYIEKNELDFSCFDVSEDDDFYLKRQNKKYSDLQNKNPLIIIANYTFDCIKQDAFKYKDGKLLELQLGLRSRYKNFNIQKSKHLSDLRLRYECKDIESSFYYDDPFLNELLKEYESFAKDNELEYLLMPLGAIRFLKLIHKHNPHYFMISGDKGISLLEMLPFVRLGNLITYDGCYAFMMNYHALGSYLKKMGGDYLPTQNGNEFKISCFSGQMPFSDLIETRAFFKNTLEKEGADEYCYIYTEYFSSSYRFNLKGLISFLRLSQWDPQAYIAIHDRCIELIPSIDKQMRRDIKRDLEKVRNNIYQMNIEEDIYYFLGVFYQSLGLDESALELYENSISLFSDKAGSYNNAAIIYEKQKNPSKALLYYKKAYELDKKNVFARRRFLVLSGKPTLAFILPLLKGILVGTLIFAAILYIQR